MIADQVNALNRAREVAAVANLIRLAAASQQSSAMKSESDAERQSPETEEEGAHNNNKSPSPSPSPVPPPTTQQVKRISFSVDSLLSDVRRSQPQQQPADLSVKSHNSSEEEDKSLIDSAEEADVDEDDEDVDIEDGASEASDSSPKISRPSPTLAAGLFHPPHLMAHPHFPMHMRVPGAPFAAGPAPHGWPLPYGLAAAAWAQHASQFVGSKFFTRQSHVILMMGSPVMRFGACGRSKRYRVTHATAPTFCLSLRLSRA